MVQMVGGWLTQLSVTSWYPTLTKSSLNPPGYVFGIVWSILYVLMALAAARVYFIRQSARSRSLAWWTIQLVLGLLWTAVFFGQREMMLGLVVILMSWLAVAFVTIRFYQIDRLAGLLMLPLLCWISFASYLNAFIVAHN